MAAIPVEDGGCSTECETDDEGVDLSQLFPSSSRAGQTAYDILAHSIGNNTKPEDLTKYTKIRRVKSTDPVYKNIELYVANSHCHPFGMEVVRIYKTRRFGEKFHPRGSYRMMLWHGTKTQHLAGILKNGFAKPNTNTGQLMYGTGVYFADRASKSAQYCGSFNPKPGTTVFMFLCDVNLGKVYKARHPHNEYNAAPPNFDTVKGNGQKTPKWRDNRKYHGSILPVGPTVVNESYEQFAVQFNEYIVYNPSQVVMSFLVEIKIK